MTTLEVLKAARELISDESRWTQGVLARDNTGKEVAYSEEEAVCWCANGAVAKCLSLEGWDANQWDESQRDLWEIGMQRPHEFNDTHSHAEVLALFDKAIARLENET